MVKIKWNWIVLFVLFAALLYTRFVNLGWGLPYPMHPDERNMADAIVQLHCTIRDTRFAIRDCFNPHFFAYGQLPLYASYVLITIVHFFLRLSGSVQFGEAVMALRLISAASSIGAIFVMYKLAGLILDSMKIKINSFHRHLVLLLFIFSPSLIQFAHFGTTESLLIFFYSVLIYVSVLNYQEKLAGRTFLLLAGLLSGSAVGVKMSSVLFMAIPLLVFIMKFLKNRKSESLLTLIYTVTRYGSISVFFFVLSSPFNLIDMSNFLGSMKYESDVAFGNYIAFYTKQFMATLPIIFQFSKIFPYAVGWPILILFLLGFFFLSWKNKSINILRFAFLFYFFPTAFMYAKWTRFMAPVMPVMISFAALFLMKIYGRLKSEILQLLGVFIIIIPGIAFLSIYQNPDVRFTASNWIYALVPSSSKILSETANVVDIPINSPIGIAPYGASYQYISFNHYDLDTNTSLPLKLGQHLRTSQYVLVPSRRVFANFTCIGYNRFGFDGIGYASDRCRYLTETYPRLNDYYHKLFSYQLGFYQAAQFSSFPKLCVPFTQQCLEFNDEGAEETFTVFDHPVIRIFQKT